MDSNSGETTGGLVIALRQIIDVLVSIGTDFFHLFMLSTLVLLCVLLVAVERVSEEPDWVTAAKRYRFIYRFAKLVGITGIAIMVNVLLLGVLLGGGQTKPFDRYYDLVKESSGFTAALLIGLVAGTLRLFFDRALDDPSNTANFSKALLKSLISGSEDESTYERKTLVPHKKRDVFILTFLVSAVGAAVYTSLQAAGVVETTLGWLQNRGGVIAAIFPILFNVAVGFGFLFWVYSTIFRRLVDVHHFSGRGARAFLSSYSKTRIPVQSVVIGPIGQGKTTFCEVKNVRDEEHSDLRRTVEIRFSAFLQRSEDQNTEYVVSMIDTPGEKFGDHLRVISDYRTDVLVLVLRSDEINWQWVAKQQGKTGAMLVNDLESLGRRARTKGKADGISEDDDVVDESPVSEYLRAFLASTFLTPDVFPEPFRVKRFLLFVNIGEKHQAHKDKARENLNVLGDVARTIGRDRLMIQDADELCEAAFGEAKVHGEGRFQIIKLLEKSSTSSINTNEIIDRSQLESHSQTDRAGASKNKTDNGVDDVAQAGDEIKFEKDKEES